ncbi:ATP-dependent zinc metalloprotease FtsH, partial [Bittarella massiliensis]|nr:ATP-dependent zinc metalloprotease FtsH [Bittarella massiliensis (ex Durand et al. 2017)]
QMFEDIVTLLGGRVAESLMFDDISTGASNDIERATNIARAMVTRYGFSKELGPLVYGTDQQEVFWGRDLNQARNYSEEVASKIDKEMRAIIDRAYSQAKTILEEHTDALNTVAKVLLEYEKVDGETFIK